MRGKGYRFCPGTVLLDMTINYFNELPSFKVADNGYKLLVAFAFTDLVNPNPLDVAPWVFFLS
jgi:hypothetical protein